MSSNLTRFFFVLTFFKMFKHFRGQIMQNLKIVKWGKVFEYAYS